jgi:hypothetical protein
MLHHLAVRIEVEPVLEVVDLLDLIVDQPDLHRPQIFGATVPAIRQCRMLRVTLTADLLIARRIACALHSIELTIRRVLVEVGGVAVEP